MSKLYNSKEMPLSNDPQKKAIQEKLLRGEEISIIESLKLGTRDKVIKNIGDYKCKSNYCYRTTDLTTLEKYIQNGTISNEKEKEYIAGENNAGIDWYLGGICLKYGNIIIEVPAYENYFIPTIDNGIGMTKEVDVRHMKSSPQQNPIPISMITNIFDYSKIKTQNDEELSNDKKSL